MRLEHMLIENVRSYRDAIRFEFGPHLNIFIGPNGGGKTNLLDTITLVMLNFFLVWYKFEFREEQLHPSAEAWFPDFNKRLNKYDPTLDSIITLSVIPDHRDADNIRKLKSWLLLRSGFSSHGTLNTVGRIPDDHLRCFEDGTSLTFTLRNHSLEEPQQGTPELSFLQYTRSISLIRGLENETPPPDITLPIFPHRSTRAQGFADSINIGGVNVINRMQQWGQTLRQSTMGWSNLGTHHFGHLMREAVDEASESTLYASAIFDSYNDVVILRKYLSLLGYDLKMKKRDLLEYTFEYIKGDRTITPTRFSSGEREIFDFMFGIVATNVRNGLVIIDEPELHLHPRWQSIYLSLFEELAAERNLQCVMSTHSPVFVTHHTIDSVTRIYQRNGVSCRTAIAGGSLPGRAHLVRIVHSHNNEKIFFADRVVLVEGITDRLVFENLIKKMAQWSRSTETIEVVEVHGKANFGSYTQLLDAIDMPSQIIADLDYAIDLGGYEVGGLFETDVSRIDTKVFGDKKSRDRISVAEKLQDALQKKNWEELERVYEYVKNRFAKLRSDLLPEERKRLDRFRLRKREEGIFILSKGELEDYLPAGARSLNGLVALLSRDDWECELSAGARSEMIDIAASVVGLDAGKKEEVQIAFMDAPWAI